MKFTYFVTVKVTGEYSGKAMKSKERKDLEKLITSNCECSEVADAGFFGYGIKSRSFNYKGRVIEIIGER